MTTKGVEKELQVLRDFIDVIRDDFESYINFRDELREVEESLLDRFNSIRNR